MTAASRGLDGGDEDDIVLLSALIRLSCIVKIRPGT